MLHAPPIFFFALVVMGGGSDTAPFQKLTFEQACKRAADEKKIVLIDFYTTWCGPCKMLDRETWPDPDVRKWLEKNTIALKLDAEKEVVLAEKFKINVYPTILLIKPDGAEIDRILGFRPPEALIDELKAGATGKDSVARAKDKLDGDDKNNPMNRQQYARALAMKGKNEEALKEYLWCFDHGLEHNMAYTGVRLSFLLSEIGQLGRQYPPALDELRKRRDSAEKAVLDPKKSDNHLGGFGMMGGAEAQRAMEVASLNRTLGDDQRTLVIFDKLADRQDASRLRKMMLHEVLDPLIEARRYDDVLVAVGDPMTEINSRIDSYNRSVEMFKSRKVAGGGGPDKSYKAYLTKEFGKYYECLLGAKKPKKAAKVADRMLGFDASEATFVDLIRHATRAGDIQTARELVRRAEAALDDEYKSELHRVARKLPAPE